MGRDRDPFDRTIAFVRERVAALPPLQGATIPINGLAKQLNVSQTPVREALATLAGEGLIMRTDAGYAGATLDPKTLASHYDLAEVLVARAIADLDGMRMDLSTAPSFEIALDQLVVVRGASAIREAYRRVAAQLTPFIAAAALVTGDGQTALPRLVLAFDGLDRRQRTFAIRGPLQRRQRSATRILAAALGLQEPRQI